MKSLHEDSPKVSHPILGRPLVQYVLDALKPLGLDKTVAVVGHGGKTVEKIVSGQAEVVWQKEQKGTGHAVMMAAPLLKGLEGETIVCCGDTPLLRTETLEKMFLDHEEHRRAMTVMTSILECPFGYGRIHKTDGRVDRIIEQKDCTPEEAKINEVNAGVYIFNNKKLFEALGKLTTDNAAGEYYLTDVLGILVKEGENVGAYKVDDFGETLGVNDRFQLSIAAKMIRLRVNKGLMLSGVTIEDPDTAYIAPTVRIGQDTVIKPNTHILGNTVIGADCVVGPNTYLDDCEVGDGKVIFQETHKNEKI
jgi:bifunctional UDP-N-acetylglucosamine pyrophosphorylase/glucosamine-1-phosphate N-acetyltransferase